MTPTVAATGLKSYVPGLFPMAPAGGSPYRLISTPLWVACLAWLALLVALQSILFWLHLPFDQRPDQDFILAYNALVMNDGLPQEYFDHTGYTYLLLLAHWFQFLHAMGFLDVDALIALPPVAEAAAFEIAWQEIIEAGRALTILVLAAYTVVFAMLASWLFEDRRIGFFAGLALATGMGAVSQIGVMRTELLSAFFVTAATLFAAVAAAGRWPAGRFVLLAASAFLGILAVLTKVFAIIPLTAAPLIALSFGTMASTPEESESARGRRTMYLVALAVLVSIPAGMILFTGLSMTEAATYPYHQVGGGALGFYQGLLGLWIIACVVAYAVLWRVPFEDSLSAVAALVIGASLGVLVLLVRYDVQNVIAATHPLEHMFVFSTWSDRSGALAQQSTVLSGELFKKVADAAWSAIGTRFTAPERDNLFLVDIGIVVALLIGFWASDRRWAVQAGLLFLTSWSMQSVFLLRYSQLTYHIYSDPFTILTGAVVLARFRSMLLTRLSPLLVVGLVLYAYWGLQKEVVSSDGTPVDPAGVCSWQGYYLNRIGRFPICAGVDSKCCPLSQGPDLKECECDHLQKH